MKNTKLYFILTSFDKYEQNRLRKYLQSPYFNRDHTLVALYELLIDEVNANKSEELEKECVWTIIQPEKEYDDVRFRKYCSDLLKLIEGYIAQEIYENSSLQKTLFLAEAVGERKLKKFYNATIKTARKISAQDKKRTSLYYWGQYEIERYYYELTDYHTQRQMISNIEAINSNLDIFFISEKLKYCCSALTRQEGLSHDYQIQFIEEIAHKIEQSEYLEIPSIAVYYQIYLMLIEKDNPKRYFELKERLQKYIAYFPQEEAYHIYTLALSYCTLKVNQGNQSFVLELFELYKTLLKEGLIYENGKLSPWTFKNIVLLSLRLGEYAWTEDFIHNYSKKIPEKFRENALSYNLAQLYFYQKKYDKVIEQLQFVEYEDPAYNLNSKIFLMETYYETDELEPLYSLFESFRAYLNRHKDIPEARRRRYLNFIKFTKKLTKTLPGDQPAVEKLKKEINASQGVVSVKWLKEKIAELEG